MDKPAHPAMPSTVAAIAFLAGYIFIACGCYVNGACYVGVGRHDAVNDKVDG
jgi:hypothetical protein